MDRLMFQFLDDYRATSQGKFLCIEFRKGEIVEIVHSITGARAHIIIKGDYGLCFSIPMEKGVIRDFKFLQNKVKEAGELC